MEKENKKQEKEAAALEEQKTYAQMLENRQYVFMGNTLSGDAGAVFSVTPTYNFFECNW